MPSSQNIQNSDIFSGYQHRTRHEDESNDVFIFSDHRKMDSGDETYISNYMRSDAKTTGTVKDDDRRPIDCKYNNTAQANGGNVET